mgnify:CR=1 FL=1
MLRAGMSARDRDDAARALALSVMDFNSPAREPAAVKGWDTPEAAREASPVRPSPGGEGTPPVSESIPCGAG